VVRDREFEIELTEAPTGARWRLAAHDPSIELLRETLLAEPGGAPGAAARRVFTLTARSDGDYTLTFDLARPRDPTTRVTRAQQIRVRS
jgi:hypothetical protein